MYEFAKRWFRNGNEITGIQLRGLITSYNKYHLLHESINTLFSRGLHPRSYHTIPSLVVSLMKHMNVFKFKKQENNMLQRVTLLHAFRKYVDLEDFSYLVQYMKEIFPTYEGQLPNNIIDFNNIFYMSMEEVNQQTMGNYLNNFKKEILSTKILEPFSIGIASEEDLWTSPIYYLSNTPMMEGLINKINQIRIMQSQSKSISEFVKVTALPDPNNVFDQRSATLLIGATAKVAKKFKAMFDTMVIQGKPAMPSESLQGTVFRSITTELSMLRKANNSKVGLVPGEESQPPKLNTPPAFTSSNINDYI